MDALNHALFLMLNAPAEPSTAVMLLALAAAKYLIALVPLHIALLWVGGTRSIRFLALTAMLALGLALAANHVIGVVAYTPRPFMTGIGHTLIDHRPSSSFPSNHGTVFFTYAFTFLLFGVWRLALTAGCIGLLVAWSRIYLGVHFPFDMAGAAIVGLVSAIVALVIMRLFGARLFTLLDMVLPRRLSPLRG